MFTDLRSDWQTKWKCPKVIQQNLFFLYFYSVALLQNVTEAMLSLSVGRYKCSYQGASLSNTQQLEDTAVVKLNLV